MPSAVYYACQLINKKGQGIKMNINKIKAAAKIARTRTSDKRWLAAIDKAVAGIESGWWIVTELHSCLAITTETGKTYFANGVCQCEAYKNRMPCKHRALHRLNAIAEETAPEAVSLEVVATKGATSDARSDLAALFFCGFRMG